MIMAAAAAVLATPAAAQQGQAATHQAATQARAPDMEVTVAFAPPIGRSLRYRLVKTGQEGGRDRRTEIDFTVRFERIAGGGYSMTVDYIFPAPVRGQAPDPATALLQRGMTVRLDARGDIVAIEREAEYWDGISAVMEALTTSDGASQERGRELARQMFASFRALPDAERIAKLTENFAPVLTASTIELTAEPIRASTQVATIFGPMDADMSVTLERVTPDAAHIRSVTEFAPEALEAAVRSLIERMGEAAPTRFRVIDVDFSEQIEVSRATGLTRRYRIARILDMEENGVRVRAGPTMTIELVTP